MGSLAFWSGVSGAGQGIQEYGKQKAEAKAAAAKADADQAREEALVRLRHQLDMEARGGSEKELIGARGEEARKTQAEEYKLGGEQKSALQKEEYELKGEEAKKERTFKSWENAAEREKDIEVAKIGAAAKGESSTKAKKWESKMITTGGSIDPNTGMITGGEQKLQVFSPYTAKSYIQNGDIFVPQAEADRRKMKIIPNEEARKKAMEELYSDPERFGPIFLDDYGWVPADVMKYLVD